MEKISRIVSYLLVAAVASCATFYFCAQTNPETKLQQLESLILECFIGEADQTKLEDAAADAMVNATGDKWSYYIPASEYAAYQEQMRNAYVGIGVTINSVMGQDGINVLNVDPSGGAFEAGMLAGDVIVAVQQQDVLTLGMDAASELIRGEENTQVEITVLRGGEKLNLNVTRRTIKVAVAKGQMLGDDIGLIKITNFDERCAEETLAALEDLVSQGAKSLIFDVRYNPGGYKHELVKILDYLLPECVIFRSQTYTGEESVSMSDASCLEVPMAVLINGSSYSAAEFFAAALDEYDRAVLVGEATTGKSYFQSTFEFDDGSAVGLSVGKYFTPNGRSLADEGGLKPEVAVEVTKEEAAQIYAGTLTPEEDPQIQAAVAALKEAG